MPRIYSIGRPRGRASALTSGHKHAHTHTHTKCAGLEERTSVGVSGCALAVSSVSMLSVAACRYLLAPGVSPPLRQALWPCSHRRRVGPFCARAGLVRDRGVCLSRLAQVIVPASRAALAGVRPLADRLPVPLGRGRPSWARLPQRPLGFTPPCKAFLHSSVSCEFWVSRADLPGLGPKLLESAQARATATKRKLSQAPCPGWPLSLGFRPCPRRPAPGTVHRWWHVGDARKHSPWPARGGPSCYARALCGAAVRRREPLYVVPPRHAARGGGGARRSRCDARVWEA